MRQILIVAQLVILIEKVNHCLIFSLTLGLQ